MKFAKILQSELVPEWKKQYINYRGLKRLLKSIDRSNNSDTPAEVSISIPQSTVDDTQQPKQQKRRPNNLLVRVLVVLQILHINGRIHKVSFIIIIFFYFYMYNIYNYFFCRREPFGIV